MAVRAGFTAPMLGKKLYDHVIVLCHKPIVEAPGPRVITR